MSKNLIPQIAEMLGLQLGEEFKVQGHPGIYQFELSGLYAKNSSAENIFGELLCGKVEVIKLPWKPKQDEVFYTFGIHATEYKWVVVSCKWWDNVKNLSLYKVGWIYRSQKEAESALPSVATEMGVSYEL